LRLLHQAPGHFFLDYETADVVTFVQVGISSGWDMHLITDATGYARAFLSHDEYVAFAANTNNSALVDRFVGVLDAKSQPSNSLPTAD